MSCEEPIRKEALLFPVLGIRDGKIFCYCSYEKLTTIQKSLWKKGYFLRTHLVDAAGNQWQITGADWSGYAGKFFGFSILLGQVITVCLRGKVIADKVDLGWLKRIVRKALEKECHWVLIGSDSVCEFTRKEAAPLLSLVANSDSVASIMQLLSDRRSAAPGPNS